VLANPYGLLFNAIDADSFLVHPYKRPTIGSIPELEAASLADVIAFHKTYYRPDNATLIVAGDYDPKELDAWVDCYFAPIPRPDTTIPRVTTVEPEWDHDRMYHEHGPNVPLPAVAVNWLAPPAADADTAALRVAAAVLGLGDSSRLHQALVYRQQLASEVDFYADLRKDKGLMTGFAIVAGGKDPAAVRTAMLRQVEELAAKPVDAQELDKVKTQMLTSQLNRRQTAIGKAFALGQATLLQGDPARANSDLAALQAVSAADVQRVVKKYLIDAHKVSIDYTQQATDKTAKPAAGDAK
jgi:zinc protease